MALLRHDKYSILEMYGANKISRMEEKRGRESEIGYIGYRGGGIFL